MRKFVSEVLVVSLLVGNGIALMPLFSTAQVPPLPDMVLRWNEVMLDAHVVDMTPGAGVPGAGLFAHPGPTKAARMMAMVHIAMYDAANAIERTHTPYVYQTLAPAGASMQAAIMYAAHGVLVDMFPAQAVSFDAALVADLALIPDGQSKLDGIVTGQQAAAAIILARANDGNGNNTPYIPSDQPGFWRSDPLHPGQSGYAPNYGSVTPFGMSNMVNVPPAPTLTSQQYTDAYNEVKSLGEKNSVTRTPDQTNIGIYWGYDGSPGLGVPPRLYNQIAQQLAEQEGNTELENARMFMLLNMAQADAGIASWHTKYIEQFWRPITAIREADVGTGPTGLGDGNPDTIGDINWEPLGAPASNPQLSSNPANPPTNFTPPFPAYTSGHSTFGSATFRMLANFFGRDNVAFTFTSEELNGVTKDADGFTRPLAPRSFTSLSQAAEENARSRIYLGIHWAFDAEQGIVQGRTIADDIFAHVATPLPSTDLQALATGPELVLGNAEFTVTVKARNFGPLPSTNTVVTTAVPADFVFNVALSDPRCALGQNSVVTCAAGLEAGLPVGETASFDLRFTAGTELCSTTATLVTSADGTEADPESANNSIQLPVFVGCPTEGQVELSATLTGSDRVFRGDEISYQLDIVNGGPGLAQAVQAVLPLGSLNLASTGNPAECTQVGNEIVCTGFDLSAGSSRSFALKVVTAIDAQCPAEIETSATVTSQSSDYYPGNNQSDEVVTDIECEPQANMSVGITAPSSVQRETELRTVVRATNSGPATATNVVVSVELPAGVTFQALGGSPECQHVGATVDCRLPTLAIGASHAFDVVFATLPSYECNGTVESRATVDASERDIEPGDNVTNTVSTTITCNSQQEEASGGGSTGGNDDDDGSGINREEVSRSHGHKGHGTTEAAVVMAFLAHNHNIQITDNSGQDQAKLVGHFAFAADASRVFALKMDPFDLRSRQVAYAPYTEDELSVLCGMKKYLHQEARINRMQAMMPWVIEKLSAMLNRDAKDVEAALEGEATCS